MKYVVLKKPPLFRRLAAFLVDLMILNIILIPFDWFFNNYIPADSTTEIIRAAVEQYFAELVIGLSFYFIIMMLYFSIFEYLIGKTPGKGLWKIAVVQTHGKRQYFRFLIRSLQVFFLIPIWFVDVLFVFSKKRDRMFERISKTTVVVS